MLYTGNRLGIINQMDRNPAFESGGAGLVSTIDEQVRFSNSNLYLYTVTQLCKALKFQRSTYYKALVSVPSNKQLEYDAFSEKIQASF